MDDTSDTPFLAMGECLANGSLPVDSQIKVAALPIKLVAHQAHICSSDPSELSQWL